MKKYSNAIPRYTIGIDLGDRKSQWAMLDKCGEVIRTGRMVTTAAALQKTFGKLDQGRFVIENGPHSRWVSRELEGMGKEVIVANPRKVRLISHNDRKSDKVDPIFLARLGRVDPGLLFPIRFRSDVAQADLAVLKGRDALVRARCKLINQIRGSVKAVGQRLVKCSSACFARKASGQIPESLKPALNPLLEAIDAVDRQVRIYDRKVEQLCREKYPETGLVMEITGVGPITSLAFVLVLELPERFERSRQVGAYVGLTPKKSQSGGRDPELRISKAGNEFLRRLLVGSSQYILGPFGPDCDLRRHGLKLAGAGGKNAKKRAVIGVARKVSVLMHRLWITGEVYDPFYNSKRREASQGAAPEALAFLPEGTDKPDGSQVQGTAPLRCAPAGDNRLSCR